jgi:hypothetical protein
LLVRKNSIAMSITYTVITPQTFFFLFFLKKKSKAFPIPLPPYFLRDDDICEGKPEKPNKTKYFIISD